MTNLDNEPEDGRGSDEGGLGQVLPVPLLHKGRLHLQADKKAGLEIWLLECATFLMTPHVSLLVGRLVGRCVLS